MSHILSCQINARRKACTGCIHRKSIDRDEVHCRMSGQKPVSLVHGRCRLRRWPSLDLGDLSLSIEGLIRRNRIESVVHIGPSCGGIFGKVGSLGAHVYTIDKKADRYYQERDLDNIRNLSRYCGNSVSVMKQLLTWIPRPVLFHLAADQDSGCSLDEELKVVAQSSVRNPVIVVRGFSQRTLGYDVIEKNLPGIYGSPDPGAYLRGMGPSGAVTIEPRRLEDPSGFVLLTTIGQATEARHGEFMACLVENLACPMIDYVVLFTEFPNELR